MSSWPKKPRRPSTISWAQVRLFAMQLLSDWSVAPDCGGRLTSCRLSNLSNGRTPDRFGDGAMATVEPPLGACASQFKVSKAGRNSVQKRQVQRASRERVCSHSVSHDSVSDRRGSPSSSEEETRRVARNLEQMEKRQQTVRSLAVSGVRPRGREREAWSAVVAGSRVSPRLPRRLRLRQCNLGTNSNV